MHLYCPTTKKMHTYVQTPDIRTRENIHMHICGNKMPTRCKRGFYCRSYCLLNIRFAGCCSILQTRHITLSSTPDQQLENHSIKYHRQQPLYNTLELLMMGVVVPETC